jgi:hypothetical protein
MSQLPTGYEAAEAREYLRYRRAWIDADAHLLRLIQRGIHDDRTDAARGNRNHHERVMMLLGEGLSDGAKKYIAEFDKNRSKA